MQPPKSRAFYLSLVLAGTVLTGCNRGPGTDLSAEVSRLNAELEATKQKLASAEKDAQTSKDALALATANSDSAKKQIAEKDQASTQKDAKIRALETEIGDLKRGEAARYAEASAAQAKGVASISLDYYQKFARDFPSSPLVADANRAIAELNVAATKDANFRASVLNEPKRQERELSKKFSDGVLTAKEIAPLLRNRSAADVVRLLGRPTNTYRNGTEIGYADKIIDDNTGERGTLVIKFENDAVATIRVGYQGREIHP